MSDSVTTYYVPLRLFTAEHMQLEPAVCLPFGAKVASLPDGADGFLLAFRDREKAVDLSNVRGVFEIGVGQKQAEPQP